LNYNNVKTYQDWNYKSLEPYSTGYEEYYSIINKYRPEYYLSLSFDKQKEVIDEIFEIYRKKDIFPLFYFNENGISKEILNCLNRDVYFDNDILDFKFKQGNSLLKFIFPNFHKSVYGYRDNPINSFDKFNDDKMLKEIIGFQLNYDSPIPMRIASAMNLNRQRTPTNFNSMRAKALYEKYCIPNGIIYDFACGYGGRMLGALCSKNNYKYIGVEPNSETNDNLLILGTLIENSIDKKNIFSIYKDVSENFKLENNSIDFAFSSPPYFNLEKYSDEDTQCYIRYPEINSWFEKYVIPTIENIHYMLKENSYYAVNIADFNANRVGKINLVDKWVEISEKIGFDLIDHIFMKLSNRGGNKNPNKTGGFNKKEESIYVFKKVNKVNANNYHNRKVPKYLIDKIKIYNENMQSSKIMKIDIINWYKSHYNLDISIEKINEILNNIYLNNDVDIGIAEFNKILR
jgi:hypothetical protein